MNKNGRPKSEDSRSKQYRLRMNDDESRILDCIREKTGESKATILRKSLENYYEMVLRRD